MINGWTRKNFTKMFIKESLFYSELDYLRSCGLHAIPHTKESILVWNNHLQFATEILEWKKNPATDPYRKKKTK